MNFSTKNLLNKIFKYAVPITICLGMQNAGSLIDMVNVKDRLSILGKPIYAMLFPRMAEGYKFMVLGSIIVVLWSIVLIQTAILQGIGKLYVATIYILFGIILKVFINYNVV